MWVVVLSAKQCSKLNKNMNTSDYCGAKGSRDSGPFHIKPKTHAEEEEVPEDERRESKLPGYTAEDDPILGRPKSRKREGTASPEAVPSRKADSVDSYKQLTQAFGFRIVTNSKAPQPLSALLSLSMRDGETLKTYSGRYWEMYNEMEGNFDGVAINHFKSNLPNEHGLRKSLTGKLATSMRQLMDRIEKYKRVEEN